MAKQSIKTVVEAEVRDQFRLKALSHGLSINQYLKFLVLRDLRRVPDDLDYIVEYFNEEEKALLVEFLRGK